MTLLRRAVVFLLFSCCFAPFAVGQLTLKVKIQADPTDRQLLFQKLNERGATAASQRRAHFVSALCVAWPDGHLEEFEARVDGVLVWPPRGKQGFGYDPMFLPDGQPDGHARTFGEMSSDEKHGLPPHGKGLSHRARAFLKLAEACLE